MAWWETVLRALWLFLPAYMANMAPVFVAKLFPSWNHPIDGGRVGKDGNRLLGAGKTWRGLFGGALLGGIVAYGMVWISGHWDLVRPMDFGFWAETCSGDVCLAHPGHPLALRIFLFGCAMGLFALVGDAVKSYFKRRRGKQGGAPWFPFDQLDFVVFGLAAMFAFSWLLPPGWVRHALTDDWLTLATLLVLTPALHLLVNRIGYWLKLKKVPW